MSLSWATRRFFTKLLHLKHNKLAQATRAFKTRWISYGPLCYALLRREYGKILASANSAVFCGHIHSHDIPWM